MKLSFLAAAAFRIAAAPRIRRCRHQAPAATELSPSLSPTLTAIPAHAGVSGNRAWRHGEKEMKPLRSCKVRDRLVKRLSAFHAVRWPSVVLSTEPTTSALSDFNGRFTKRLLHLRLTADVFRSS